MAEYGIAGKTRELLRRHGLVLKKSLGQHFLTDSHILDQIIQAAELGPGVGVLEIGPGVGALTERLAAGAGAVAAVELDDRLVPVLQELFVRDSHVRIIHGDAMKLNLHGIIREQFSHCSSRSVVANLPYYVTTPILMRLLEEKLPLDRIVVMIQKEVAERLTANPGTKDYGSITVTTQYYSQPEWITRVPKHVFVPRPRVESAVIRLHVRKEPPVRVADEILFFQVIRAAFGQRRKTLLNALSAKLFKGSKRDLGNWIELAGIDPRRRGETLSLEEFAQLANILDKQARHML